MSFINSQCIISDSDAEDMLCFSDSFMFDYPVGVHIELKILRYSFNYHEQR